MCLVAYLLGGAKIFPGLVALAAMAEGSHSLRADSSPSAFAIILHHDFKPSSESANGVRPSPVHRHGLAAKLFCVMAAEDSFDPDHVLHLANGFVSESVASEFDTASVFDFSWAAAQFPPEPLSLTSAGPSFVETHPPPQGSSHLSELRVTVLVI